MSKPFRGSLFTALAAGGVLTLAIACGDGDAIRPAGGASPDRAIAGARGMPSVARDVGGHASVAPTVPAVAAELEPTPAPKPAPVAEPPTPKVALGFDGHLAEARRRYDAGEFRVALEHAEQAAVIKPKHAGARVQLARTLLVLGDEAEARTYVEQALELAPTSAHAWSTLGRIELADGDLDAAIASFRRAAEEDPESSHAWNNLGYSLMAVGQYEEAASALEHATAGSGPTEYMWNNLGMAYEHVDRIREARAAYRQAASLGSSKGEANMSRLEGVRSLRPGDEDVTARSRTIDPTVRVATPDADAAPEDEADDDADETILTP